MSGRTLRRIWFSLWLSLGCGEPRHTGLGEVSSTLYTRADTDDITIYSPRTRVTAQVTDEVAVEAVHTLDAWSGASIDVRTSATQPIHEIRNEVRGGAGYTGETFSLRGSYRYSTENDYWAQGGVGTLGVDLFQHNTQLVLSAYGGHDTVGKANDEGFRRPLRQLGARLSLTQVLDRKTLVEVGWESMQLHGYQASPYRYVAIGGQGTCASLALHCIPEQVPEDRYRQALFGRMRRALTRFMSAGLEYRFYFDSWGIASQTVAPDFKFLLGEGGTLVVDYRFYTQRQADFYRPQYFSTSGSDGYFTRDRELSALYSNRVGLTYLFTHSFRDERVLFDAGLRCGLTRYRYLAFVGLERVDALEAALMLSLALP